MSNIFEKFVIENEIIVDATSWTNMQASHPKEFIIQEISDAIVLFKIKLPYREISLVDAKDEYFKLKSLNARKLWTEGEWANKFDYRHDFLDEYIGMTNVGNKASDFFHQTERWKCDATGYPSPQRTWDNEKYRLTLFKALFSLKVKEINPKIFRSIISLRKYIAAQFRASAAKAIYDRYEPKKVLDLSMGWGDRILGAYTSNTVEKYVGFDPNMNLMEGYSDQIKFYHGIDPAKKISFNLYANGSEDDIMLNDEFDMIFTSPPYYDKEKYDKGKNQSYIKYPDFDSWMKDFLMESIISKSKFLRSGGLLIINISDIYTRKKHYPICDLMNDMIIQTNDFDYHGCIGLKMPKRPMSKSANKAGIFGEPVWIHRKK